MADQARQRECVPAAHSGNFYNSFYIVDSSVPTVLISVLLSSRQDLVIREAQFHQSLLSPAGNELRLEIITLSPNRTLI